MSSDSIITIQDLLKGRNRNKEFDDADPKTIRLIRHTNVVQDSIIDSEYNGYPIYKLYRDNFEVFKEWQNEQKEAKMKNVKYLVVFIGEEHCYSRFAGIFKNNGQIRHTRVLNGDPLSLYDLQEIDGFDILKDQVVIDWGKGTANWMHNWDSIKEVICIEQKKSTNDGIPVFTRYEDVVLTFTQLNGVIQDRDWRKKLECLNCVYVILDKATGKQYVGVTYKDTDKDSNNGILNRWSMYAKTGHGGNKMLKELINREGLAYAEQYFQWSILETLPINVTPKVAIDRESLYKEKLGTREHGYNEN